MERTGVTRFPSVPSFRTRALPRRLLALPVDSMRCIMRRRWRTGRPRGRRCRCGSSAPNLSLSQGTWDPSVASPRGFQAVESKANEKPDRRDHKLMLRWSSLRLAVVPRYLFMQDLQHHAIVPIVIRKSHLLRWPPRANRTNFPYLRFICSCATRSSPSLPDLSTPH